jgi:histidinol-phosphate aminotransferase
MTRIEQWTRPNIRELTPYSSAKDEFTGTDAVFLDANENPFGKYNRYPDPQQRRLKTLLAKRNDVSIDQIFIGNGSDEVIDLLLRIFCEPGKDAIGTFTPTYGMYDVSANIHNVSIASIPLDEDFDLKNVDFSPIYDNPKLKVLFLCSPNNPTGNNLDRGKMLELIQNFQGIVCIDEAYIEFSEQASLMELISNYDNLIVTRTMSKARGLAGARVGYAFSNKRIIELLNKVKPPYNVSSLNQEEAIQTFENEISFKAELRTLFNEREKLIVALSGINIIERIYPTAANFLLIQMTDANTIYNELLAQNIIVRNRSKQIPNTLRISVGSIDENLTLITALKTLQK